ncbi:MAG: deoxyribodipyrimidine photo-lyase [Turneriella sp.]|nr:deoxyribodipyrimidine photo-lyase [Turneriella sp.]
MAREKIAVHWFRRDLRLEDNRALSAALKSGLPVLPVFIFDPNILAKLKLKDDRRVTFIFRTLAVIDVNLRQRGGALRVFHGKPRDIYAQLFREYDVAAVFCNEDYEPYARERDTEIAGFCKERSAEFISVKDHVIFAPHEVLKDDGTPYNVFTPYSRRWLERFENNLPAYEAGLPAGRFSGANGKAGNPTLADLGFTENNFEPPPPRIDDAVIENYAATRDIPGVAGTSRLGLHLRFGTISVRALALRARELSQKYLAELIWREFYQMILWYYPHTTKQPFRAQYAKLHWPGSESDFKKWAAAETGYPLVDAGVRELVETGFMHNRVRMVVASFLTKHLLCDWRWGDHFFAQHLLDFELASNIGGWQWSAGIGVDAAPYFRIFNPAEQQKRYDARGEYVKRWLGSGDDFFGTPKREPMIDHRFARERCLKFFMGATSGK